MSKQKQKAKKKPKVAPKSKLVWWPYALLAGVTFLLFGNTIQHSWTLDDFSVVKDNRFTKQGVSAIPTLLTSHYRAGYWSGKAHHYRPAPLIMFAAEWQLSPDNASIHHFMNVFWMAVLAMVLFYFLRIVTQSQVWSMIIALLFIAHPLHVEVVANIKSRDEIMALLFMLISLISWWKFNQKTSWSMLSLGIGSFFLALLFKENAITLIGLLVLVSALFFKDQLKEKVGYGLMYLIPAGLYLAIRARILNLGNLEAGLEATSPLDNLLFAIDSPLERMTTAVMICGKYLLNLIFPNQLGSDFGYNQITPAGLGDWRVLLTLFIFIGLAYLFFNYWKKQPLVSFGIGLFAFTFSIFSNLIVKIGSSYGDRFLFIPSLGFLIALVFGLQLIVKNWQKIENWSTARTHLFPAGGFLILLFIFFSVKTIDRNADWYSSYTLYKNDIEVAPNSAKLNYHYALECAKKGRESKVPAVQKKESETAAFHFEKAMTIFPAYADAYSELGLLFYRSGNVDRAMELYKKCIELQPNKANTYSNMGIIHFNRGELQQAETVYKKAITLDPAFVDAYRNLGSVYARQQRFAEAITVFKKALEYEPNSAIINFYLGSALRDAGREAEGKPYLQRAKELEGK